MDVPLLLLPARSGIADGATTGRPGRRNAFQGTPLGATPRRRGTGFREGKKSKAGVGTCEGNGRRVVARTHRSNRNHSRRVARAGTEKSRFNQRRAAGTRSAFGPDRNVHPAVALQRGAEGGFRCTDGRVGQAETAGDSFARRDGQRKNGGLFTRDRPRAGRGPVSAGAGAGNRPDAANCRAVPPPFPGTQGGNRCPAQPSFTGRTSRPVASNPRRPGADRHRRALGGVRTAGQSRIDRRRRGAREFVQAGGIAPLSRARRGSDARPSRIDPGSARLGNALSRIVPQCARQEVSALHVAPSRGGAAIADDACSRFASGI